jgi:plasmid stabilization system protein ParE
MYKIARRAIFQTDVIHQFAWYFQKAGENIAWRFEDAVNDTVVRLSRNPTLGRLRHFRDARLQNLRSFQVTAPFERFLVFFRIDDNIITMERLMESSRNLGRRLVDTK